MMASKNFLKRCYAITRAVPNAILGRPVWAFVWVTRQCKHTCEHCYVYDNSKPHMDFQVYQQTIDKLKDLGIVFVSIFGGEPTLHPQLIDMIKYASSKKRKIFLNTDITGIAPELIREIVEAGTNIISFSLDRVKPVKSNVRAVETADSRLNIVSDLQAKGYDCTLHCNVTWHKQNIHEGRDVVEYLYRKGNIGISVRPAVYPFPVSVIPTHIKELLLDAEDAEYVKALMTWISEKKRQGYPILNPYTYLDGFSKFVQEGTKWGCGAFRDILSIDVDGKISQCSYFLQEVPEPLRCASMQVEDLSLSQIKEYRRKVVEHNLEYCENKCYSPAYYCTAYYRKHIFELLKYYLKG